MADTENPTVYQKKMRKRDSELETYPGTNCPQIEMEDFIGKKRKVLARNTKDVFRLIQPIPNSKAKPFKLWLAQIGSELVTSCNQLKLQSADGKYYKQDLFNTKGVLRLIQSIPSPNTEPFKLWLDQVGSKSTTNCSQLKS